jgi:membrane associated rhomboid family serine protease
MGLYDRPYSQGTSRVGFGYTPTPWVKRLLIANTAIFLLMWVGLLPGYWTVEVFGFSPSRILFHPWSPITYMFVHGSFWHLFFNMLGLFFFGPPLERAWGSDAFVRFYIVAGLGGALFSVLFLPIVGDTIVIGASGALYGLLLAFALRWPDAPIYLWAVLPIKAKYFVGALGFIALVTSFQGSGSGVANWTHLGGLVTAFVYLRYGDRINTRLDRRKKRRKRRKSGLAVEAKVKPKQRSEPRRRRRPVDTDTLDEVDRILDKIRASGINSLTDEERDFLDEMSRRYRKTT